MEAAAIYDEIMKIPRKAKLLTRENAYGEVDIYRDVTLTFTVHSEHTDMQMYDSYTYIRGWSLINEDIVYIGKKGEEVYNITTMMEIITIYPEEIEHSIT